MGDSTNKLTIEDIEVLKRVRNTCYKSKCNSTCLFYNENIEECSLYGQPYRWEIEVLDHKNN